MNIPLCINILPYINILVYEILYFIYFYIYIHLCLLLDNLDRTYIMPFGWE